VDAAAVERHGLRFQIRERPSERSLVDGRPQLLGRCGVESLVGRWNSASTFRTAGSSLIGVFDASGRAVSEGNGAGGADSAGRLATAGAGADGAGVKVGADVGTTAGATADDGRSTLFAGRSTTVDDGRSTMADSRATTLDGRSTIDD